VVGPGGRGAFVVDLLAALVDSPRPPTMS